MIEFNMIECYSENIVKIGDSQITTDYTEFQKECILSKPKETITLKFGLKSPYQSYNNYSSGYYNNGYSHTQKKFASFDKLELIFKNYVDEVYVDSSKNYLYIVDVRACIEQNQAETHVNYPKVLHTVRIDKVLHFQVRDQPFDIFKSGKIKHICFKINRLILNDHTLNDMFQVHQSLNTSLFKNTNYVHFVVGSENFQVHVDMLSLKSDVFRAMFDHNMTEKNSKIIKIEDFEAEVVEEMIKFIYTNELSETIDHTQDLYAIAHKYQIDNLQAKCIEYLIFNLNFCNAASLYKFAKLYDIDGLIQTLNSFFKKYVKNMVKEETYRSYLCENINSENLKDILFLCAEFNESLGDVEKTAFTFIKNNISTVIDQLILVDWFKKHGTFAYELFKFINYQDSQD